MNEMDDIKMIIIYAGPQAVYAMWSDEAKLLALDSQKIGKWDGSCRLYHAKNPQEWWGELDVRITTLLDTQTVSRPYLVEIEIGERFNEFTPHRALVKKWKRSSFEPVVFDLQVGLDGKLDTFISVEGRDLISVSAMGTVGLSWWLRDLEELRYVSFIGTNYAFRDEWESWTGKEYGYEEWVEVSNAEYESGIEGAANSLAMQDMFPNLVLRPFGRDGSFVVNSLESVSFTDAMELRDVIVNINEDYPILDDALFEDMFREGLAERFSDIENDLFSEWLLDEYVAQWAGLEYNVLLNHWSLREDEFKGRVNDILWSAYDNGAMDAHNDGWYISINYDDNPLRKELLPWLLEESMMALGYRRIERSMGGVSAVIWEM